MYVIPLHGIVIVVGREKIAAAVDAAKILRNCLLCVRLRIIVVPLEFLNGLLLVF